MDNERLKAQFYSAVLSLKTKGECDAFFTDLCTIKELTDLPLRLEVARMLNSGLNYQEITEKTSVSSATISRVNRCLVYGKEGGYRKVLAEMEKEKDE